MYIYIYDQLLRSPKLAKTAQKIELRLSQLNITGPKLFFHPNKTFTTSLTEYCEKEASTIVVVGNDLTLLQIVNLLPYISLNKTVLKSLVIGYIPVDKTSVLKKFLFLQDIENTCDALASRLIINWDLGEINREVRFIKQAEIIGATNIILNNEYTVNILQNQLVSVQNIAAQNTNSDITRNIHPNDKVLNLTIQEKGAFGNKKYAGMFACKEITISNPDAQIIADNTFNMSGPITIKIISGGLKIITGKEF